MKELTNINQRNHIKTKQTIEIEVPDGKKAVWKEGKVVFEDIKSKLPKTWEEFCEQNKVKDGERFINNSSYITDPWTDGKNERYRNYDRNILPNKRAAEQHLVLMQLHQLRDCYRQGWVPDYTRTSNKFCIVHHFDFYSNKHNYKIIAYTSLSHFLSFQSKEIAEEFLNNFRDLIEQAGDLI